MMKWAELINPLLSLRQWRNRLSQLETELENSFGRDKSVQVESGTDLTPNSWHRSGPNTLTKYTLEPNTITILTISTPHPLVEMSSNTTTPTTSQINPETGTSKEPD